MLGVTHDAADSWDQVADLIYRHVTSQGHDCDRDRAGRGMQPLRMLGVGIEGAPVCDGQVMPLSRDRSRHPSAEKKLNLSFRGCPGTSYCPFL